MTTLSALAPKAPPTILTAIETASARTGVDFDYLLRQAAVESSFTSTAQAQDSSARGLYQFIDSTWLDLIGRHGAQHGLGNEAAVITRDAQGKPVVADAQQRRDILALRDDPRLSALMAAEYARDNRQHLEQALGRKVAGNELYLAHFLGPGGATRLLQREQQQPNHSAAALLPAAARANRAVFFAKGKALSVADIVDRFAGTFGAREAATGGNSPPRDTATLAAMTTALPQGDAFTTTRPQALLAHTLLRSLQRAETPGTKSPSQRWEA
ncbi:MAG TPA: lytic transglycosylase domain-containing protein [Hyphomicrobiales bacterium]|nr:lytic transglycosylase domain-containing protein [Hyphomicrobiales bacterium]